MEKTYCVKRHIFPAGIQTVEDNLTHSEAERKCQEYNIDEIKNGDGIYVRYSVYES